MYNILWIDDQYECLSELMERCEVMHGFKITKCRFAKEGMDIFEKDLEKWSAVVLDAKVLMETEDEVPNLEGLRYSRDRINELSYRRFVPMFIFTGQPDLTSSENFGAMVDKFYSKGDDDDQMIADIIEAADNLENTQIINKYQEIFQLWPDLQHDLLRILRVYEHGEFDNNSVLNDIRKALSNIFVKLNNCGILIVSHDGSNIAACSKEIGQKYMGELIPVYIQRALFSIVSITNPGSHRSRVDTDVAQGKVPYLIPALVNELLTVLLWGRCLPEDSKYEITKKVVEQLKAKYGD